LRSSTSRRSGSRIAAGAIAEKRGTAGCFQAFDALREADDCEPYEISETIHSYSTSRGLRVLDVGCGNGYVLFHYARHGAEVIGVDLTKVAFELSRKRFALGGLPGELLEFDGNNLPFPDECFDIVCSMGVLHHVSNVVAIFRVLKPGHSWKNLVLLRLCRMVDPRYRGRTQQEALNMNDGDACPLALVYSRSEAARLFSMFSPIEFILTQLSRQQLLMLPQLAGLAEKWLPYPASRCWPSRVMS
jgi:SAM-dependent methyltransferase